MNYFVGLQSSAPPILFFLTLLLSRKISCVAEALALVRMLRTFGSVIATVAASSRREPSRSALQTDTLNIACDARLLASRGGDRGVNEKKTKCPADGA